VRITARHRVYLQAVEGAVGADVDYAMLEALVADHLWSMAEIVALAAAH